MPSILVKSKFCFTRYEPGEKDYCIIALLWVDFVLAGMTSQACLVPKKIDWIWFD